MVSESNDSETVNTILFYIIVSIGIFFSVMNLILILANFKSMFKNLYARFMFIIQVCYLAMCIINAQPEMNDETTCKMAASWFDFFWMVHIS